MSTVTTTSHEATRSAVSSRSPSGILVKGALAGGSTAYWSETHSTFDSGFSQSRAAVSSVSERSKL